MNIKPILFSTPMVQAILEGRKTMTRRIVKSRHESGLFRIERKLTGEITGITSLDWDERPGDVTNDIHCPYGKVGDVLWVREKWRKNEIQTGWPYHFYADDDVYTNKDNEKWKPSIFMPKDACRIFLEITNVRVERLQDISEADAIREGIKGEVTGDDLYENYCNVGYRWIPAKESFRSLWIKINSKESWLANPWVWVIEFIKTEKPEILTQ